MEIGVAKEKGYTEDGDKMGWPGVRKMIKKKRPVLFAPPNAYLHLQ